MFSWKLNEAGTKMVWEGFRKGSGYVAVGISEDAKMGDDTMYICSQGAVKEYYATGKSKPSDSTSDSGLKLLKAETKDGNMYCQFESGMSFTAGVRRKKRSIEVQITDRKYHIHIARGTGALSYHSQDRQSTEEPSSLNVVYGSFGAGSNLLLKLHGICMIAAWIGCVGTGIIFARYFKTTWKGEQLLGKDKWFSAHRLLMTLGIVLTMVGLILAFVHTQGWQYDSQFIRNNPHPVTGIITFILALIQPIMAAFRPHPGTSKRPIFNIAHWLVGSIAFMLGLTSIFLASNLAAVQISAIGYVVCCIIYIVMYVLAHLALTGNMVWAKAKQRTEVTPLREKGSAAEKEEDLPGSTFRKSVLGLFSLFSFAVFIALTVLISIGN